jgi:hypothetical protein
MASAEKLTNVERRYRDRRNILADSADLKPLTLRGAAIASGTREYAHYALAFCLRWNETANCPASTVAEA